MASKKGTEIKAADAASAMTAMQGQLTDEKRSALAKYTEMFVGAGGVVNLLKYEIFTSFFGPLPGALGFLLRKIFYPKLLGACGRGVVFGRSVTLRHPGKIKLGNNVIVDDHVVLDAKGTENEGIDVADNVIIGRGTIVSCKNGNIRIGRNSNIAANCFLQSARDLVMGENVLVAAYCYFIGGGDHSTKRTDIPIISQEQVVQGIEVKDNCWIGAGVNILDGITVGRDAIVGAGAVVASDVGDFDVVAGVPARVVKARV